MVICPLVIVVVVPTSSTTFTSTGMAGGVRSMFRLNGDDGSLVLPAASVARATNWCSPSGKVVLSVTAQLPLASAVVVPTSVMPS
ncbi:hypothetical protein D3C80_899960 [compost metagenome]